MILNQNSKNGYIQIIFLKIFNNLHTFIYSLKGNNLKTYTTHII